MATLNKRLYVIVWQEREREPDWLHVVADNLTETRAQKYVKKHLQHIDDNPDAEFEYFWFEAITEAEGVGTINNYDVIVARK